MDADKVRLGHAGGLLGLVGQGGAAVIEGGQAGGGLLSLVRDLDANLGGIGDGGVKAVEIEDVLAAESDSLVASTQRQLIDGRAEYLGLVCKRHSGLLPSNFYMKIFGKHGAPNTKSGIWR